MRVWPEVIDFWPKINEILTQDHWDFMTKDHWQFDPNYLDLEPKSLRFWPNIIKISTSKSLRFGTQTLLKCSRFRPEVFVILTLFCVCIFQKTQTSPHDPCIHPSERKIYFRFSFKFRGEFFYLDFPTKVDFHFPSYTFYDENFSFTYTLKKESWLITVRTKS